MQHDNLKPDLREADLRGADLKQANLVHANLWGADLSHADLTEADISAASLPRVNLSNAKLINTEIFESLFINANLYEADFTGSFLESTSFTQAKLTRAILRDTDSRAADFSKADLRFADLSKADLRFANLNGTDLRKANLKKADLRQATLISTNLNGANLQGCRIYGISAWDVKLHKTNQSNLIITPSAKPAIQVDNLEVAQFIYLLLNNEKIREVIDTITSKVVLILGRFTPERMAVLEALRHELRQRDYLPILFDFEKPRSKDITGTIMTLASLSRFIIADLTDPNSVPHELATLVPGTIVPLQAILLKGRRAYPMFADLKKRYHWVLKPYLYESKDLLLAELGSRVIAPAEAKARKLTRTR
jgi:uncharacterized protein YjbI with pentapeptide repeats